MQPVDDSSSGSEGDGIKWAAVSDRLLVPLLDQLFYHVARLVNIQTMLKLVYIYILEFKKTLILRQYSNLSAKLILKNFAHLYIHVPVH